MKQFLIFTLLAIGIILSTGCGQKGDLVRPTTQQLTD